MTLAELRADLKRRLDEASGSGVYFGTEDLNEAINAGYLELSDVTEWNEQSLGIPVLHDRQYYDLFSLIGPRFLSIRPIFDEQTSHWLIPTPVHTLDAGDPRWERVEGRPHRTFVRGLRWLGIYPRALEADGTYLKVVHTALPPVMVEDTDEPGFPETFHVGCVLFALFDLFAQDGETQLAIQALKDYQAVEDALGAWVNRRMQRPDLVVMGASTGPR